MPAIAPALRTGRCVAATGAAVTVDAGAFVEDDVGDAVEEELVSPRGVDSSGNSYSSVSLIQSSVSESSHTWPGCNMNCDFSALSR
jgi:hypothetical protein